MSTFMIEDSVRYWYKQPNVHPVGSLRFSASAGKLIVGIARAQHIKEETMGHWIEAADEDDKKLLEVGLPEEAHVVFNSISRMSKMVPALPEIAQTRYAELRKSIVQAVGDAASKRPELPELQVLEDTMLKVLREEDARLE